MAFCFWAVSLFDSKTKTLKTFIGFTWIKLVVRTLSIWRWRPIWTTIKTSISILKRLTQNHSFFLIISKIYVFEATYCNDLYLFSYPTATLPRIRWKLFITSLGIIASYSLKKKKMYLRYGNKLKYYVQWLSIIHFLILNVKPADYTSWIWMSIDKFCISPLMNVFLNLLAKKTWNLECAW